MPAPDPKLQALQTVFEKAYAAYQADNDQFWRLFNLMTLVNGGFLFMLSFSSTTATWIAVPFLGFCICIIWAGMQWRYGRWCEWWNKKVGTTELVYLSEAKVNNLRVFHEHAFDRLRGIRNGFPTRITTAVLPILFAIAWFFIGVLALTWPQSLQEQKPPTESVQHSHGVTHCGDDSASAEAVGELEHREKEKLAGKGDNNMLLAHPQDRLNHEPRSEGRTSSVTPPRSWLVFSDSRKGFRYAIPAPQRALPPTG